MSKTSQEAGGPSIAGPNGSTFTVTQMNLSAIAQQTIKLPPYKVVFRSNGFVRFVFCRRLQRNRNPHLRLVAAQGRSGTSVAEVVCNDWTNASDALAEQPVLAMIKSIKPWQGR